MFYILLYNAPYFSLSVSYCKCYFGTTFHKSKSQDQGCSQLCISWQMSEQDCISRVIKEWIFHSFTLLRQNMTFLSVPWPSCLALLKSVSLWWQTLWLKITDRQICLMMSGVTDSRALQNWLF